MPVNEIVLMEKLSVLMEKTSALMDHIASRSDILSILAKIT